MFCEAESEFQIAARPPQPCPHIPFVTHHSLAHGPDLSEGRRITATPRILIVTPRLEFPANATKQTLPPISNRYKTHFFRLGTACASHFAAVPSGRAALHPSLKKPWPPCGARLIANLELEFSVNPIRITKLEFSNRKFFAILSLPTGATNLESQATEFLIENARLESDPRGKDFNRLQISNRERMGFPVPLPRRSVNRSNLEPQTARRIRDTSADNASLRAFPRCYASCGSRRKSE
jgi:hypothetical protein